MKPEDSTRRNEVRLRILLLLPAVLVLSASIVVLFIDGRTVHATLDYDQLAGERAARGVAAAMSGLELELRSAASFLSAVSESRGTIGDLVDALQASDPGLLQVAYLSASGERVATAPRLSGLSLRPAPEGLVRLVPAGGATSLPYFVLSLPVSGRRRGLLTGAVSAEPPLQHLDRLARRIGGQAGLVAGGERLLFATGRLPPGALSALGAGRRILPGAGGARVTYLTASRVPGTPWRVLIVHPSLRLFVPLLPCLLALLAAVGALLMVRASMLLLRRRSIARLPERLHGSAPGIPQSRLSGRFAELLLRETHHRVKNDLQMLLSLFNLSDGPGLGPGDHEVLVESKNRVQAISLIHEQLYRSPDLSTVDIRGYLTLLVQRIEEALVSRRKMITIVTRVGDYRFDVDTAVVCGLLLNELLTNSLKHAFPRGRAGLISVQFDRISGDRYRLEVRDDGVGLPAGGEPGIAGSLGLRIARELTDQLGGNLAVDESAGTAWSVEFSAKEMALGA